MSFLAACFRLAGRQSGRVPGSLALDFFTAGLLNGTKVYVLAVI